MLVLTFFLHGAATFFALVMSLFLCWCCHSFDIGAAILFALVLMYRLAQTLWLLKYFLAQPFLLLFSHWCYCFSCVDVVFVSLVSLVLPPLLRYAAQCLEHQISQ